MELIVRLVPPPVARLPKAIVRSYSIQFTTYRGVVPYDADY